MKALFKIVAAISGALLGALLCASPASAQDVDNKALADSLYKVLGKTSDYKQQVLLLYDIMDLSEYLVTPEDSVSRYKKASRQLLKIAQQNKDEAVQLDILRILATNSEAASENNDSLIKYTGMVEKLTPSNTQKEVLAYLRCTRVQFETNYQSDSVIYDNLLEYIGRCRKESSSEDIYQRTENLFSLCDMMYKISPGDMYISYLKKLEKLISELPPDGRNIFPRTYLILAANSYAFNGMQKEALAADRQTLKLSQELDAKYKRDGRIYHNFDRYYYIVYRRMMLCPDAMTKAEYDSCYHKLEEIAATNSMAGKDFNSPGSIAKIRYLMANRQYKDAIPLLEESLSLKKPNSNIWKECLRYRIEAGRAIGNDPDWEKYSQKYIDLLEDSKKEELEYKAKEFQIAYDTNELERQVSQLQLRTELIAIIFFLVIIVILAILLTSVSRSRSRLKKMNSSLDDARSKAENASKMKTIFIQNMNHEIRTPMNAIVGFSKLIAEDNGGLDEEEKDEYSRIISENSDLLLDIVNDLLDISELEAGKIKFKLSHCSMNEICTSAVNSCKARANDGVAMIFEPHENDLEMNTDKRRVTQVLINFLTNACKNTEEGSITVDYAVNRAAKKVTLSVTDTGAGIPPEKAESIFGRFEKLDNFKEGAGIGLNICELIANGLNGEAKLDTAYTGGARFLFTFPC
jgi:signal transduction histidine kinase